VGLACKKVRSIFQLVLDDAVTASYRRHQKFPLGAMPLAHDIPAVAIQHGCVRCVADLIRTVAHFCASQWLSVRWMASLMLAEAMKRPGRQGPSTAVGGDSRSSSPEHCTGPRASALCLLCHFHLKICVDAAVTQLGRVPSFPLVMAQSAGQ
jgi:hypothetical protein